MSAQSHPTAGPDLQTSEINAQWQAQGDFVFRGILALRDFNREPEHVDEEEALYQMMLPDDVVKAGPEKYLPALRQSIGNDGLELAEDLIPAVRIHCRAGNLASELETKRSWMLIASLTLIGIGASSAWRLLNIGIRNRLTMGTTRPRSQPLMTVLTSTLSQLSTLVHKLRDRIRIHQMMERHR